MREFHFRNFRNSIIQLQQLCGFVVFSIFFALTEAQVEIPESHLNSLLQIRNYFKGSSIVAFDKSDEELLEILIQNMFDGPLKEYRYLLEKELPKNQKQLENEFKKIVNRVLNEAGQNMSPTELFESCLNIGFSSLDPYFRFDSGQVRDKMSQKEHSGRLGLKLQTRNGEFFVVPREGSPSYGKLIPGSQITKVNGSPVFGKTTRRVTSQLSGVIGESVEIEIINQEGRSINNFNFVDFKIPDYEKKPESNTIIIRNLSESVIEDLEKSASKFKGEELTLDIREFVGADLKLYAKFCDLFLSKEQVLLDFERVADVEGGLRKIPRRIIGRKDAVFRPERINILQSSFTASAAEAFIVALKQAGEHEVLTRGQTTFGKSLILYKLDLKGGGFVEFSTGRMLRSDGSHWEGKGLAADIKE